MALNQHHVSERTSPEPLLLRQAQGERPAIPCRFCSSDRHECGPGKSGLSDIARQIGVQLQPSCVDVDHNHICARTALSNGCCTQPINNTVQNYSPNSCSSQSFTTQLAARIYQGTDPTVPGITSAVRSGISPIPRRHPR